jgi:hypothetical protein
MKAALVYWIAWFGLFAAIVALDAGSALLASDIGVVALCASALVPIFWLRYEWLPTFRRRREQRKNKAIDGS